MSFPARRFSIVQSGTMLVVCAATLSLLVAGCSTPYKQQNSKQPFQLAKPRLNADSVILESHFLHLDESTDWVEKVWSELDEQQLPNDVRRRLLANGMRCGIAGVRIPDPIQQKLQRQADDDRLHLTDASAADGPKFGVRRQWQARARQRNEIVMSPTQESLVLLLDEGDGVRVESFPLAQCLFAVRAFPRGDGIVRLELIPEIHFGTPKQKFVGDGAAFRFDSGRDAQAYPHLKIEIQLIPGQTVALMATDPPRGLGDHFFAESDSSSSPRRMLMIRLLQSQPDDLFDVNELSGPLASTE